MPAARPASGSRKPGFPPDPTGAKSTEDFAVRRPEGRYIRSRAPHGVKNGPKRVQTVADVRHRKG
nr:hypothetical protein [Bacillaceae bacterium]